MIANELKDLIYKRTQLNATELVCPREKSETTPCVCRDGDSAMTEDLVCVGCGAKVIELLELEKCN